jgi:hypothetical protein
VLAFRRRDGDPDGCALTERVAAALNDTGRYFLKTADWRGRRVLRISVIANGTDLEVAEALAADIATVWARVRS